MKYKVLLFCFIITSSLALSAQNVIIKGTVTDEDGNALPGATILAKGSSEGTTTDVEGRFFLSIPGSIEVLVFSFVGYITEEIQIGNRSVIDVAMSPDVATLSEVVVVGYGTQEKKDVTGALSSISSSDFDAQPLIRTEDALQGRAAGVQVSKTSGAPGGGLKIRVRGGNSINGSNEPLYVVDGFVGADISIINPSDIQSIDVLKDASATAIYGSRGANGVVIITTKSAQPGKAKIAFEAFNSWDIQPEKYDLLSGSEYMEVINAKNEDLGLGQAYTPEEINAVRADGDGTDWQDELFKMGLTQNYQLSFSGGSDDFQYYISGNYVDQEGIIINTNYQRFGLRTNFDATLTNKLDLKFNLYGTRTIGLNTAQQNDFRGGGAVAGVLGWSPNIPVIDPLTGDYSEAGSYGPTNQNPIYNANERNLEVFTNNVLSNVTLTYEIATGLTLSVGGGLNIIDRRNERFTRYAPGALPGTSTAEINNTETVFWQNTNILNYRKVINNHSFDVSAIHEQQSRQIKSSFAGNTDFVTTALGVNGLALGNQPTTDAGLFDESIESFIGRINYGFKDKYLMTATFRADGSSKFQEDNRWGYFPSISGAWRVSEESFMENTSFVSDLKLRASYGETGSQAIDPYQTLSTLNLGSGNGGSNYPINGQSLSTGVGPGDPANPNLTWETTEQTDLGFDLGLFAGRLNLTFDYYIKKTTDLLLDVQLPDYSGGRTVLENIGEVENRGVELMLSGTIVDRKDFSINSSFNISFNQNQVLDIGKDSVLFLANNYQTNATIGAPFAIVPGEPLGQFRGLIFEGIWGTDESDEAALFGHVPGDPKYADLNGDFIIDGEDLAIVGNAQPDFRWGFNTDIRFKNFDLNLFFQGVHGNEIFNFARYYTLGGVPIGDATSTEILNRWTPDNQNTEIAAFTPSSNIQLQSSQFIEDGSFIRLKNITLGYSLPESISERIGFGLLRVYFSTQNLFTITDYSGYDPELSSTPNDSDVEQGIDTGAYPFSRTFTTGVRIQF